MRTVPVFPQTEFGGDAWAVRGYGQWASGLGYPQVGRRPRRGRGPGGTSRTPMMARLTGPYGSLR